EPIRCRIPRASSSFATRLPVLPVPPMIRVCFVLCSIVRLLGVCALKRADEAELAPCTDASLRPRNQDIVASMQGRKPRPAALQWDDVRLFLALQRARTVGE